MKKKHKCFHCDKTIHRGGVKTKAWHLKRKTKKRKVAYRWWHKGCYRKWHGSLKGIV